MGTAADLLFTISGDASDATNNVEKFRALLGQDLDQMASDFDAWTEKVVGDLTSFTGAAMAGTAILGAAVVAGAAYAAEAGEKYVEFAEKVERGTQLTGIGAEDMSKLAYAAQGMGVDYDRLVSSLAKFASGIVAANDGTGKQAVAFARLGITEKDLQAGEQNMLPLLEKVMDKFNGTTSAVEKTAMARELLTRGGAELVQFLSMGSAGLEAFTKRAEELGLVLTEKDLVAVKEFKIAVHELKAEHEALDLEVGQKALPLAEMWSKAQIAAINSWREALIGAFGPPGSMFVFWRKFADEYQQASERIQNLTKAAMSQGGENKLLPPPAQVKEAATDFMGFSNQLDALRTKIAATGDEWGKVVQEQQHLQFELGKSAAEFQKLKDKGSLTAETIARETAAAMQMVPAMMDLEADSIKKLTEKRNQSVLAAGEELRAKLNAQQDKTWQSEEAGWEIEIAKLREHLQKKGDATAENLALLDQLEQAGIYKRSRAQAEAFAQELVTLNSHLASVLSANMNAENKLEFQYDTDRQKFSEVEEEKSLKVAKSEGERLAIRQAYAMNNKALDDKYAADLQALHNSQGWQGIFGDAFKNAVKGDEELTRQWAESENQSLLMVQVAAQSFENQMRQGFDGLAKGMGQNIAQALVYQKSIGDAMRSATASTLESIAAESFTYAIYSTALGFMRLAQHDFAGAEAAFQAAAEFGAVGAIAGVAGRAVAPPQGGTGASGGSSAGGSRSSSVAGVTGTVHASGQQIAAVPLIHITVTGPIIGPSGGDELAGLLNDAVQGRDVRLLATQVKQPTRAVR